MTRKHKPGERIDKLRQAEIMLAQAEAVADEQFTKAGLSLAVGTTDSLSFWHQLHTRRAGDRGFMPRNLHF